MADYLGDERFNVAQEFGADVSDGIRFVGRVLEEAVERRDDARGDMVDPESAAGAFIGVEEVVVRRKEAWTVSGNVAVVLV